MKKYDTYRSLRGIHQGRNIIVAGLGNSATKLLDAPPDTIIIGVNDIGRLLTPDYNIVLNVKKSFNDDRWDYIENCRSKVILTHIEDLREMPIKNTGSIVRIPLGSFGGFDIRLHDIRVDYTSNSPFVGIMVAHWLGARNVGLIGVDFTPNHFFGETGTHNLANRILRIDAEYERARMAFENDGVGLYNLSDESRLTKLPKMSMTDFLAL